MIRKTTAILAVMTVATLAAHAQQLSYTLTGGNISGSLGGVGFSDASWSFTATADASTAAFYQPGGPGAPTLITPAWSLDVTPTLTITSGSTVLSATLTGWDIESRDYTDFNPSSPTSALVFMNAHADGNVGVGDGRAGGYIFGPIDNYNNLQSPGTYTGTSDFLYSTCATSAGDLIINGDSAGPGTFTITAAPVPEPSALALSVLGVGLLVRFRRRK